MRLCSPSNNDYSLSLTGEGWGEGVNSSTLTLPILKDGPLPSPVRERGFSVWDYGR